jgi:hypothetical protein
LAHGVVAIVGHCTFGIGGGEQIADGVVARRRGRAD